MSERTTSDAYLIYTVAEVTSRGDEKKVRVALSEDISPDMTDEEMDQYMEARPFWFAGEYPGSPDTNFGIYIETDMVLAPGDTVEVRISRLYGGGPVTAGVKESE